MRKIGPGGHGKVDKDRAHKEVIAIRLRVVKVYKFI